nr:putative reverse transcriptase domain-containing protein [Tanacetum cinerariifolium]
MTKAQDQRLQSMKEQGYNVDRDKDKDKDKSLTTKAISMNSRRSVTMNSLRRRLLALKFESNKEACLDSFEEHVVHCKELSGFKYRYDMVRNVLFDICRCAGIPAKKEAHVNLLTDPSDGRSTLRPADVLVFGWD